MSTATNALPEREADVRLAFDLLKVAGPAGDVPGYAYETALAISLARLVARTKPWLGRPPERM